MQEINWNKHIDILKDALSGNGAFLIARDASGRANPMTIGWAQVGIIWSRPTLTVLVRRSRYTYSCLVEAPDFTVNVPTAGTLDDQLLFCGTKSGRDLDKAAACGLTMKRAQRVLTPIIAECRLHYECQVVLRKQLSREDFSSPQILDEYYQSDDHHMLVIGQIVAAYAS
ncbi:MAG TPA: flavin reductase family protein [Candidatus Acetothermia bacterium]|nr:flavin reductase family protein [Candidatus Acetothermia bacterium]